MMPRKIIKSGLGWLSYPLRALEQIRSSPFTLRVLLYHDIPSHLRDVFSRHLKEFTKNYTFLTPDDFEQIMTGARELESDALLLTFDDGFKSNYEVAQSVLRSLNIKALFFIPTGFIDTESRELQRRFIAKNILIDQISEEEVSDELCPMTWEDLSSLLSAGHRIGAHTVNHRRLSEITSKEELVNELNSAKMRLQEKLGTEIRHFAFPFGNTLSINKKALALAKNYYKFIHSGIRGPNVPTPLRYAIKRDSIDLETSSLFAEFTLLGGADLWYRADQQQLANYASES